MRAPSLPAPMRCVGLDRSDRGGEPRCDHQRPAHLVLKRNRRWRLPPPDARSSSEHHDSQLKAPPRWSGCSTASPKPGEVLSAGGRVLNIDRSLRRFVTFFCPPTRPDGVRLGAVFTLCWTRPAPGDPQRSALWPTDGPVQRPNGGNGG